MIQSRPLFASFFLGGFECSSFRTRAGERRDLLAETGHDRHAASDFHRLHSLGIRTVRSGIRWHRVEREPGVYDFSSELPMIRAARETNTQVIWDLFHYGWPDFLEVFSPAFVEHFAGLARAFAGLLAAESRGPVMVSPVNEISFLAWCGGDEGLYNPFTLGRGDELKRQLVRAFIAGAKAVWEVLPRARIVSPEPVIHIVAAPERPWDAPAAEAYRRAMFQAWDMIAGRLCPELGGEERFLDVLGLNFYPANQWIHVEKGETLRPLRPGDALYRPFREMLREVYERYRRPLFVAETGAEGEERAPWLAYVAGEVRAALQAGIPVQGICLYPVTDYPAWDDRRCCPVGLFGYPDEQGRREIYRPLAEELARQQRVLEPVLAP